jgi:hypothetical protein
MLKLGDEKKREAAEQKERNKNLLRTIKEGKLTTGVDK